MKEPRGKPPLQHAGAAQYRVGPPDRTDRPTVSSIRELLSDAETEPVDFEPLPVGKELFRLPKEADMIDLREASATLAAIRRRGVLRVGTTGDYTPFSLRTADGWYRGADIDMAYDLAARLGVGLEFVPTVWARLLDDFLADRFDIAMGGVTVTEARAAKGFFSVANFVDGKRPLARREDRDRFTSIAAIDRPGVRLIANPGSANEAFARAHFRHASVIIHHDNASVFDELVAGRADVMITDGLEADHQAQLHPELAAVPVAAPFTRLEKAYFFAQDRLMKEFVDRWLGAAIENGQWQRSLDGAMQIGL